MRHEIFELEDRVVQLEKEVSIDYLKSSWKTRSKKIVDTYNN
jgi:hypothetical protein